MKPPATRGYGSAAFIGIIATGLMMAILPGHIDLSLLWTIIVGAMMACAIAGHGELGHILAIPVEIACGVPIGIVYGILVALLRIPSMIATLATDTVAQGIMIVYTGGSSPQNSAPHVMRWLTSGWLVPRVPNAAAPWVLIGDATMFLLSRTSFGRTLSAQGLLFVIDQRPRLSTARAASSNDGSWPTFARYCRLSSFRFVLRLPSTTSS